jgi:hypothetical protein
VQLIQLSVNLLIIIHKYSALVAVTIGGGVGCLEPKRLVLDFLASVRFGGCVSLMGVCVALSGVCAAARSIALRVPAHRRK